ncbi:MAG: pyruvate, phosphate dikinase/phosphoenolpyruvate synthase regulator [Sideroxydans sp.]|nr:pyruvate, phosphate dikinase/phosphoenolpyruvate synthase regulator [Sideroxydans sp.]
MTATRSVFFVSDHTGLTAETLGRSLTSQFDGIEFQRVTLPYIDSAEKAHVALQRINAAARADDLRPLVFSTLTPPAIRDIVAECDGLFLDLFDMFIAPLETELGVASAHAVGRSHAAGESYAARIDAVNYALDHDDGGITRDLQRAEIVLVGVSRCGKTPTSLYLALQFGIYAANYPLVEEDFAVKDLPAALKPLQHKLFGLTITAERLHQIRDERAPGSRYASLENCRHEIQLAQTMMIQFGIPYLDVTTMSVEEIATTVVHQAGLRR